MESSVSVGRQSIEPTTQPGAWAAGIFRAHCSIVLLLLAMHLVFRLLDALGHSHVLGLSSLWDFAEEASVPTYFSAAALLATAAIAAMVANSDAGAADRRLQRGWWTAAALLLFMAFDEGWGLHDRLSFFVRQVIATRGIFFIGWVVPYMLLVVFAVGLLLPLAKALPAITRTRLVWAALIYVSCALGIEFPQGVLLDRASVDGVLNWQETRTVVREPLMVALIAIEETGEMLAVALALRALLLHLRDRPFFYRPAVERTRMP
jgi:hypothetical protein